MEQFQNGQPVATVFWEELPDSAKTIMTAPIGSTIDANISRSSGSTWDVEITVHPPSGQAQSKTIPVQLDDNYATAIGSSAEWISEDPSDGNNQLYPLANAGTVGISNATVNGQAINADSNNVQPVVLVSQSGNVLMTPTELGVDGRSFSTETVSTDIGSSYGDGSYGMATSHRRGRHGGSHGWGNAWGYGFGN